MANQDNSCASCSFWMLLLKLEAVKLTQDKPSFMKNASEKIGLCRKQAPIFLGLNQWPVVSESSWCGDWTDKV